MSEMLKEQRIPARADGWFARHGAQLLIVLLTVLVLGVGKIVYFKAGGQIKAGEAVDWVRVFHPSDFSYSMITTALSAAVYMVLAAFLRRVMPEHRVALRYTLLFVLSGIAGGLATTAYMAFYYVIVFNLELPATVYIFDSALLAFITPITLMAALETFHYRGAWLKEQFAKEQGKREVVSAKFEALKNQLSPHFVFNSFNTLGALINEQPERAQQFLNQLSQVYRYILDNKDKETVSLGREIDSVKALLDVQQARHPDAVTVEFHVSEKDRSLRVIPLTLHTLVENVFKHNVLSSKEPVHIKVEVVAGQMLAVQNDLKPKLDVESHKIGINNLSKRYDLLLAKGLTILKEAGYFRVEVPLAAAGAIG